MRCLKILRIAFRNGAILRVGCWRTLRIAVQKERNVSATDFGVLMLCIRDGFMPKWALYTVTAHFRTKPSRNKSCQNNTVILGTSRKDARTITIQLFSTQRASLVELHEVGLEVNFNLPNKAMLTFDVPKMLDLLSGLSFVVPWVAIWRPGKIQNW